MSSIRSTDETDRPLPFLAVAGLTGFAVSQPLLSLAGANPALFVFNEVSGAAMVWLAIGLAVVPAIVIWLTLRSLARLHRRASVWGSRATGFGLAGLGAAWLAADVGAGRLSPLVGVAVGTAVAVALARRPVVVDWLQFTSVLSPLALVLFLTTSASSDLLRSPDDLERQEIAGRPESLVMVVLDELPTLSLLDEGGAVDAGRFPNFAALAAGSTWYRNYTTLSATTETALPTLLTGRNPTTGEPIWTEHPENLFSLLAPTHHLVVHESFTRMCGTTRCSRTGPDQAAAPARDDIGHALTQLLDLWQTRVTGGDPGPSLDDFAEPIDPDHPPAIDLAALDFFGVRYLEQWPTRFGDFLTALAPNDDPTLHYLHLLLPHWPWQLFDDGTFYANPNLRHLPDTQNSVDWVAAVDERRHLLQLEAVDAMIGALVAELRSEGMYDETALVVVSDHGVSFAADTGRRDMDNPPGRAGTAFVPLFIKEPHQRAGRVDDSNVMATDVLPMLADLTGVRVPWDVDGVVPGTPGAHNRGSAKLASHIELDGDDTLGPLLTYDGDDEFPHASNRRIRPSRAGDGQLTALVELLDRHDLIGSTLDELPITREGSVAVVRLPALQRAEAEVPRAFVQGAVVDGPGDAEVFVAVDGTVVTGSEVFDRGGEATFLALLPSAAVGRPTEIKILLATPDGRVLAPTVERSTGG